MYFVRINTTNINPLIKESLNVNKSLHRFSSRLPIYLYLKNNILYVFFHMMIFPVGLKYHKKYYF
jgi:hypothetical protein